MKPSEPQQRYIATLRAERVVDASWWEAVEADAAAAVVTPRKVVPVADLAAGRQVAELVGSDRYGQPITMCGYVSRPTRVRVGKGHRRRIQLAVEVTETPSGMGGYRSTVYVDLNATCCIDSMPT